MSTCEFCNKTFTNKSNLSFHQKTAKFCLKIQQETMDNDVSNKLNINKEYKCEFCNKLFNIKSSLTKHTVSCKKKSENEFEQLETENKTLKKELEDLKNTHKKELEIAKETLKEETKRLELKHKLTLRELNLEFTKKLDKEKETILALNNEILYLKYDVKSLQKLLDSSNSQVQHLNERLTTVLTVTNNNTIVNNTFNGINLSQQRFDKLIEDDYTFELYEKGSEGAKTLIIKFLYIDEDITVEVTDEARDKIKVRDRFGNKKVINFNTLLNLCRGSSILVNTLQRYGEQMFTKYKDSKDNIIDRGNYFVPISEEVKERSLLFKEKSLRNVFGKVKAFIHNKNENRIVELSHSDQPLSIEEKQPIYTNSSIPSTFGVQVTPMGLETRDSLYSPEVIEKHRKYLEEHPFDEEKYNLSLQDLQNDSDSD